MDHDLAALLASYSFESHPEGGSYLETYRSECESSFVGFTGLRSSCTGIYFLLKEGEFSSLHRIKSDEMWHFYLGGPLEIIEVTPEGRLISTILGKDFNNNQHLQYVVKKGHWFGSRPLKGSSYSFLGCTVSPGFDFQDFELAQRCSLTQAYPQHRSLIESYTRV